MRKPYTIRGLIFLSKPRLKQSLMILIILLTLPSFPRNPIPIQPVKAEEQKKTLNLIWAYHNTYSVHSVSISSDGSYIAVGANDRTREGVDVHTFGSVFLFSRDGRLLWNYSIGQYVSSVSISSDGSYIAAASEAFGYSFGNSTLFLFSRDGRLLWNYSIGLPVCSFSMSSDGSYIAAGTMNGFLFLFSRDGKLLGNYSIRYYVDSVSISSDGSYIAALLSAGRIYFFGLSPDMPPVADFSYSPSSPLAGDGVSFTDKSYDPDGSIVSWRWDFGDGTTSSERNPTHTFTSPGTYTVTLTVKDDMGAENSASKTIQVKAVQAVSTSADTLKLAAIALVLLAVIVASYVLLKRRAPKPPPPPPPPPPSGRAHLSNAAYVRSKTSKLLALFLIFLLAFPLFSQLQPIRAEPQGTPPPYKVGDWLLYKMTTQFGRDVYDLFTKIIIEEVTATYVRYRVEAEDFLIDGVSLSTLTGATFPQDLGSKTTYFKNATPSSGGMLVDPSYTGTYTYSGALSESEMSNIISSYLSRLYGGQYNISIGFSLYANETTTYYKGVLTRLNATISTATNVPMFTINTSLIDTSIKEAKSEATTLPPTLEIIDYQVFVQRELIKPDQSTENVYYPSVDTKALLSDSDTKALLSESARASSLFDIAVILWLQKHPILLPARGENFILSITVRNIGSSSLTIPKLSYTTEPGLEDLSKFNVKIEGPQLVEIAPFDKGSGIVVVDKGSQKLKLDPGETKTMFYRCRVQWDFVPPSQVSIPSPSDALSLILLKFSFEGIPEPNIIVPVSAQKEKINGDLLLFIWWSSKKLEEINELINPESNFKNFITSSLSSYLPSFEVLDFILNPDLTSILLSSLVSILLPGLSQAGGKVSKIMSLLTNDMALYLGMLSLQNQFEAINSGTFVNKIMHDPSPNYTQLVPPPIIPEAFYKLPDSTGSKALLYEYLYLAYLNASAESFVRAGGAREMKDTKYYYLQLRNAQVYAANASIYYSRLVPLLEQIIEELNRSGYLNEESFIKGKEYIAKYGLPSNVTRLLEELGFTKYINIGEVEERIKSARYEPLNVTAFKEALELSKKYNPAAFLNRSFAEELGSVSNKTLCQVVLNATGPSNATVKVDGKDYPLPSSLYLNLGTRHNLTFAQVVPGLFQDYVFMELYVGGETYTSPSIQLTVLEPVSVTAIYEARPSTLAIAIIALALLAAIAAAYTLRRKHAAKPLPPPPPPS